MEVGEVEVGEAEVGEVELGEVEFGEADLWAAAGQAGRKGCGVPRWVRRWDLKSLMSGPWKSEIEMCWMEPGWVHTGSLRYLVHAGEVGR